MFVVVVVALLVIALVPLTPLAHARPQYLQRIPNGDAWQRERSGITCQFLGHTACERGTARNQFGLDFQAAGLQWTTELCKMDSDGDNVTNGEELGDPCCEWTADQPDATQLRLDMLSHPGDADEDGARDAPRCERATDPSPAAAAPASPSPSSPAGDDDDDDDDDNVCFPAHALVRLEDGSQRRMEQLHIGDRVLVAPPATYSAVFMFTHRLARVRYPFVLIRTERQQQLQLTSGHFLYANGSAVPARAVRVGHYVQLADGSSSRVSAVSRRISHGLYNPHTLHGDLIVDDVLVSTYTTAVDPPVAHSLLAPLRAFFRLCASVFHRTLYCSKC